MSVDILKYIPDVIKDFREFIAIANAENPELTKVWSSVERSLDNQFIQNCDEDGISRFEKLVSIVPYGSDSLDERKFRVLAKWNANLPYTERQFINMLDIMCGTQGYKLSINRPDYSITIKVALVSKKNVKSVMELAEIVVPAEMVITVELLYNTWEQVKEVTWSSIKEVTWMDVKEEVLQNG